MALPDDIEKLAARFDRNRDAYCTAQYNETQLRGEYINPMFKALENRALQSRIEPMQKVARMLRAHETLIWNWFEARGQFSNAVGEGFNNKLRVVTRCSYGASALIALWSWFFIIPWESYQSLFKPTNSAEEGTKYSKKVFSS